MKMLISQEMSKEIDSRRSPNVVAKLMGLETLSVQESNSTRKRIHSRGHPQTHFEIPMSSWEQKNGFFQYAETNEFQDAYQKSPQIGRCNEIINDKRLSLVRQKFAEAKRLSMDEKLRQSKQFLNALEVLNSNKDLFLKCLQEPNPALSQDVYNLQSISPPETKRITLLRPSKMADSMNFGRTVNKDEKQSKKDVVDRLNVFQNSQPFTSPSANWKNYENPSQPTRIVILKPSPVKFRDIKAIISPESELTGGINGGEFVGNDADDGNQESREIAKAITQQMREKLVKHKDASLISSVFSNGYIDAESSFNNSETEYTAGNVSDVEVMSPASRHSWDYVNNNRFGSPYSSSFSRASYSPESSVCREAKKRLSERWTLLASNGSYLDQRHIRKSSSTLGEMLALSETKKTLMPREEVNIKVIPNDSIHTEAIELRTPELIGNSPRNLTRSKSVPVSLVEETMRINEKSVSERGKLESPKEEMKEKQVKFSFKGKVSSLFFSRNKKACIEKSFSSDSNDEFLCKHESLQTHSHRNASYSDEGPAHLSTTIQVGNLGLSWPETGLPIEKLNASGNTCESLDQPSPVSVLDQPFEEDLSAPPRAFLHHAKSDERGIEVPVNSIRSNLIDKSPPIGSIARSLTLDDPYMDSTSLHSLSQSTVKETERRECLLCVKTLLSTADMLGELQLDSFLARWHSLDSPLDPLLREKYIDLKDSEPLHEARRRQKRSTQKLVFDCVNASLIKLAGYGSHLDQSSFPSINSDKNSLECAKPVTILDQVMEQMNPLLCGGSIFEDCEQDVSILERVVRKEVAGKCWDDDLRLVMEKIGRELEEKLLDDLVQEAAAELSGSLRNRIG